MMKVRRERERARLQSVERDIHISIHIDMYILTHMISYMCLLDI